MAARQLEPRKNTLRFIWKKTDAPIMPRKLFGKEVLMDCLKLKVDDVFCLQENPREQAFELTLQSPEITEGVYRLCERRGGEEPLAFFSIENMNKMEERLITVHMFNPHVPEREIARFLESFGDVLAPPSKVKDSLGFWTGRTQFKVKLKTDENGYDGLLHPPAFFSIGADRGYCFYIRQPPFCKKCRGRGHTERTCKDGKACRFCSSTEHCAKDCTRPKACHTCGSTDHLKKDCPERGGASGGVPQEKETHKDNVAPAPHAEGGSKKRPPSSGQKAAPAKSTKMEAGPFSPEGAETGRTSEIGVQKDTTVLSVNSSLETSSGGSMSSSGMESPEAATTVPPKVSAEAQRAMRGKICVWCQRRLDDLKHEEFDCSRMHCMPCQMAGGEDSRHRVVDCPLGDIGGELVQGVLRLPYWDGPRRVKFYKMPEGVKGWWNHRDELWSKNENVIR